MNEKPKLLIKSAHLENFVLHKDTFVTFERPIILLTGGNSSGKTLFLEGCLLALGIKSQRIRDGKISTIIGSNGKVTRGTVQLNNPMINECRTICFDNVQLDEMIDNDVFSVGFEISARDSNLNYFIINDDTKHTITLSLLTQILDRINLDTRNKLVFTESGDVSELVSSSPRKRFESLLRITGMQDRFTQVAELTQKSSELTPILQRLEEENRRRETELNNLKTILEDIKEKERLTERNKYLQGALIWCEFLEIKERIDKINVRKSKLLYREKELRVDVGLEQEKLEKISGELNNLMVLKLEEERSQHNIVRDENDLKHEIETLQKDINNLEKEILTLTEDLGELEQVDDEESEAVKTEQEEKSKKYDNADAEFKILQQKYNKLTEIANLLRREDKDFNENSEIDEQIFSALKLSVLLKNKGVKFWGPLCLEIEITDTDIVPLLADILFEFVIFDAEKTEELTNIIEDFISSKIPSLSVTFLRSDYEPIIPKSKNNNELQKYVKCENKNILSFLSARYDISVQKSNNLGIITDLLNENKSTSKVLYFPQKLMSVSAEGVLKFHNVNSIEIYKKLRLHKSRTFDEIEKALNALEKLKEIKPWLDELTNKVNKYQADFLEISAQVHKLNETRKALETLTDSLNKAETENEQKEKILELKMFERQKLQEKLARISSIENINEEIKILNNKCDTLNKNLGRLQNELISVRNQLDRHNSNLEREERLLDEKAGAAKTYVHKMPADLSHKDEQNIRNQITEVEIKLRKMENLSATYEQYERKKVEYNSHARKLKRTKSTFYELMERLDHERSLWQTQLGDYVDLINKHMRASLSERFSHVSVFLSEPENINKCGLHIEARHKQAFISGATRIRGLSGGERGIVTEAFIFATHLLTYSPLHVIDEFTQRMDISTKELAFNIATSTAIRAKKMRESLNQHGKYTEYAYDPLFILACPDTTGLDFSKNELFEHLVCLRLADGNSNVINK